jgi:hypothetical protein
LMLTQPNHLQLILGLGTLDLTIGWQCYKACDLSSDLNKLECCYQVNYFNISGVGLGNFTKNVSLKGAPIWQAVALDYPMNTNAAAYFDQ